MFVKIGEQRLIALSYCINAQELLMYFSLQQIAVPRNDEWTRFARTLADINANRADAEEEAANRIPG